MMGRIWRWLGGCSHCTPSWGCLGAGHAPPLTGLCGASLPGPGGTWEWWAGAGGSHAHPSGHHQQSHLGPLGQSLQVAHLCVFGVGCSQLRCLFSIPPWSCCCVGRQKNSAILTCPQGVSYVTQSYMMLKLWLEFTTTFEGPSQEEGPGVLATALPLADEGLTFGGNRHVWGVRELHMAPKSPCVA